MSNTPEMRYFVGTYQILIRHDFPLFLIITGLYENINRLQNEENLTFLYRAPKIYLGALNTYRIAETYESTLKLTKEESLKLAKITKGYSFAFQVIGYFVYSNNGNYEKSLPDIHSAKDQIAALANEHHLDTICFGLECRLQDLWLNRMNWRSLCLHNRLKVGNDSIPSDIHIVKSQSIILCIILCALQLFLLIISTKKTERVRIRTSEIGSNNGRVHSAGQKDTLLLILELLHLFSDFTVYIITRMDDDSLFIRDRNNVLMHPPFL